MTSSGQVVALGVQAQIHKANSLGDSNIRFPLQQILGLIRQCQFDDQGAEAAPQHPLTRKPGRSSVGHQWACLPEVARAMMELLELRDRLEPYATFHLAGHWDEDGTRIKVPALKPAVSTGRL